MSTIAILGYVVAFLIAAGLCVRTLKRSTTWSLAQALSEKGDVPALSGANALPANGASPVLIASSSRLIAFLGMLAMLSFFVSFGGYLLWALFEKIDITNNVKEVGPYFLYGSSLYAPYAFNQIKEAFKS